jgi:hypothetical protein
MEFDTMDAPYFIDCEDTPKQSFTTIIDIYPTDIIELPINDHEISEITYFDALVALGIEEHN